MHRAFYEYNLKCYFTIQTTIPTYVIYIANIFIQNLIQIIMNIYDFPTRQPSCESQDLQFNIPFQQIQNSDNRHLTVNQSVIRNAL